MMHVTLKAVAELLAQRSVDSLIEGAAICLFASVMLRIVPQQNAASRFAVWFSALIAIAGAPILGGVWFPGLGIVSNSAQRAVITVPNLWAAYFVAAWAAISLLLLSQVLRSLWHLNVLRRSCIAIDPATLDPLVRETLRTHGAKRAVKLCTSPQVKVPAAIGLWRPAVVVPQWAMSELTIDELNQTILHEVAHLRRLDDWTNLVQHVVKALFFFHPAVLWIEKKASLEREIACDDAVLNETGRPRAYAECLARLAEKSFAHRSLAMTQAALGKARQMSTRLAQILDSNRPAPTSVVWRPAVLLVAVFAVGCAIWHSRSPRLLAFEQPISAPHPALVATASAPELIQTSMPVKVTPARLLEERPTGQSLKAGLATSAHAKTTRIQPKRVVHFAETKPSTVPITETMWIVVERNQSVANRQVFQIEMWHVTILRGWAASSTPQSPSKI